MKATQCLALTLFMLGMLAFVQNSFAQDTSPEYVVRVIYFIPNDREPQPDIGTKLDTVIKDTQKFYADQMEAHGFNRKTFRFEADDAGNVVVHHVNGKFKDEHYQNPSTGSWIVWNEIEEQFDTSKNIYFLALDINSEYLSVPGAVASTVLGQGSGRSLSGQILVPAARVQPNFHFVVFHEFGHAFGLQHDYRSNPKLIFSIPYMEDRMITSFCAAQWLDVHRYFNFPQKPFNQNTEIRMLTASLTSPPNVIRFRFEITDPDGLHQIRLLHRFHYTNRNVDSGVMSCQQVSGRKRTVEIVSTQLRGDETEISLQVIDVHGNFTQQPFPIDINSLLPQPEAIIIPDINLRKAIQETLDLPSEDTITQLDILKLKILDIAKKQITNLTGVEHAKNLIVLIGSDNKIRNIKPIIGLTNLRFLDLEGNQIRDATDFEKMLSLDRLRLAENPIADRTPLLALLRQKPNIKNISQKRGPTVACYLIPFPRGIHRCWRCPQMDYRIRDRQRWVLHLPQ